MPAGRLVLHVGAMKSGTTFIQSRLYAHRDLLQERGIRVPGRRRRSQVLAVQQLLRGGGPSGTSTRRPCRATTARR